MKFDFMGNRFKFFAFSIILSVFSIILLLVGGLKYGIDFKGGNVIQVRFDQETTETTIRNSFQGMQGLYFTSEQLIIQAVVGEFRGREFIIQYPAPEREDEESSQTHGKILRSLREKIPFSNDSLQTTNVGPTIGREMKMQAIIAAIVSIIGILIYLTWRFEFQSASGAIVSLLHDLIIVTGFVAIVGLEFDVTVLAAILTMLGYSVNDSIVVLDRIRENRKIMREANFSTIINDSINQTLGRTINTSLTTLFSLVSLLLLGGASIHGFALTLTVGVFFGTYSSIFIASPVLLHMTGEQLKRGRRAQW